MSTQWISTPITCQGKEVSPGLDWDRPLLPYREEVAYKIRLIMSSSEMAACEGRQCSLYELDLMDRYDERLRSGSLDEDSLRRIIDDFRRDFSPHWRRGYIEVDPRALLWTKRS